MILKRIFSILVFVFALVFVPAFICSCSSDDDDEQTEEPVAVTYATIAGTWQLTTYYGKPLPVGTYMYMNLDRKEHTVELYTNINSSYASYRKGTYTIDGDDYYGYTLSGSYGVLAGDWAHTYKVSLYPSGYMQWTAKDDASYQQVFTRIDAIPKEVLDETSQRD